MATTTSKPRAKREKSTSTKGHYVTNAVLLPAVIEAKAENKVTDKLIRMIWMIAERYSRKGNFIGYSFRADMVSAAVMNLCNNALKFNPEKGSNPFSFYTTAIHNSFLQYMADEKKHRNIRDALLIDAGSNPSFNFMQGEKDEVHFEVKESDEAHVHANNAFDDDAPLVKLLGEEADNIMPKAPELKIRQIARQPGVVTRYGPKDISIDADGNITILRIPDQKKIEATRIPIVAPVKRNPWGRKKADVVEAVVEPVVEVVTPKKRTTKKVAEVVEKPKKVTKPKKVIEEKVVKPKKATETVEKEPKAKKVAAKKTTAKKAK